MLRLTPKSFPLTIHTKLLMAPANTLPPRVKSRLQRSIKLRQNLFLNSRLLLPRDQLELVLKLTRPHSETTRVESWTPPLVELALIMPSLPLVTDPFPAKTTTSSETHGEPPGVIMATSRSLPSPVLVSAVSKVIQFGQSPTEVAKSEP